MKSKLDSRMYVLKELSSNNILVIKSIQTDLKNYQQINHPNIIQVFNFYEYQIDLNYFLYIKMENAVLSIEDLLKIHRDP